MKINYSIEELVKGCKEGQTRMQEYLYRSYAPKLLAICMRYTKDQMEAEDALQMGFIKIFQKINEYRSEGSFEGWMKRIMVNIAIEAYRKKSRSLLLVSIDDHQIYNESNIDFNRLAVQDLMRMVQGLADGYRMVFNLYAIEGYSHKEIAEMLGISEGASKSQLSRARALLRQEILKMEETNYERANG